jgi:hypothetical protein
VTSVHPGIRGGRGSGRRGRPSRSEEIEAGIRCECGQLIATHPPLPKPKPLRSWMAQRNLRDLDLPSIWTLSR